jgi:hypothetical protein
MSNEKRTEINWLYIIGAVVCFGNMFMAFSGRWGFFGTYKGGEPEPTLGFICLVVGVICLFASFSNESK